MTKIKTKEELLAAYKKANKSRREIIANRAGFNSGDEYKAHLEAGISTQQPKETLKIHSVQILDCSSSMAGGKFNSALTGINEEVSELKKDKEVEFYHSVIPFSSGWAFKLPISKMRLPISKVGTVTGRASGMTALYQAVGETLQHLINTQEQGEKILVKIFTDGGENDSKGRFSDALSVKELITLAESKGITVTFVGTNFDVDNIIQHLGVNSTNTLKHDNTVKGVKDSFKVSMAATRSYASKALAGEDTLTGFYKQSGTL